MSTKEKKEALKMILAKSKYSNMALGSQIKNKREGTEIKSVQNRKEELVRNLILENYQNYYKLAYGYVHHEADAMDIVQEGAYKAMLKANSLREESFAGTWIYRIMINAAKDYLKKYTRTYEELDESCGSTETDSSDFELRAAVDKLPMHERTLIILRFYEDKPLSEIAEILQENVNTVKSRLYRTLEKLRKELS